MGILDGIVAWIAEQIMYGLDLINTSVLGALGCDMNTFLRYFPAAETMYSLLVALSIGLILLFWVWNLFKNYWLVIGTEVEDPVRLTIRVVIFIVLACFADEIVAVSAWLGRSLLTHCHFREEVPLRKKEIIFPQYYWRHSWLWLWQFPLLLSRKVK